MTDTAPIRRALISVSDKTGLAELGKRIERGKVASHSLWAGEVFWKV